LGGQAAPALGGSGVIFAVIIAAVVAFLIGVGAGFVLGAARVRLNDERIL